MTIYSGDYITVDDWNFNQDGAYGVVGMGPGSSLWQSFISATSLTATYSIELKRYSNPLGLSISDAQTTSNVTLGFANDAYYQDDSKAMNAQALSNYTYSLDYFGFGKVYMSDSEVTSAYFESLDLGHTVEFSVNFQGMGLPTNNYYRYQKLLKEVASDVKCSDTLDGVCVLQSECSSYDQLSDF